MQERYRIRNGGIFIEETKKKRNRNCSSRSACLMFACGNQHNQRKPDEKKEEVYQSLSATDRETADLYAELYETDREQVAKIQAETKDWEQTGRKLEQDFFTIPENTKYQMEQEGYSLDDLEQAEKLSVKTGRKAIELAKAKGKHPKTGNGLMW